MIPSVSMVLQLKKHALQTDDIPLRHAAIRCLVRLNRASNGRVEIILKQHSSKKRDPLPPWLVYKETPPT